MSLQSQVVMSRNSRPVLGDLVYNSKILHSMTIVVCSVAHLARQLQRKREEEAESRRMVLAAEVDMPA